VKLDPAVLAHLEAMDLRDLSGMEPAIRRRLMTEEVDRIFRLFGEPGPAVAAVRDHRVGVDGGEIRVRTYHPAEAPIDSARPVMPSVHVLLHGGAWTGGSIDELVTDADARHLAAGVGCVVATVEYRLAPEHRFPVPVHDVIAAVRWVRREAGALGVDPSVLTVGGNSAGANLAAAAVVGAGDLGLRAIVLEVPVLDLSREPAEALADLDPERAAVLAAVLPQVEAARAGYLGDVSLGTSPVASPMLAPDLSIFPETVILTAEYDPLRIDGERFARRLRAAGVPVHLSCYAGALHFSPILTGTWPTARRWQHDVVSHLRRIHHPVSDGPRTDV
jgi:acetyl esterase